MDRKSIILCIVNLLIGAFIKHNDYQYMVKISIAILLCINSGFLAYLFKFLLEPYKYKLADKVSSIRWLSRNSIIKSIIGYNAFSKNRF